jgi:hypothetical protein
MSFASGIEGQRKLRRENADSMSINRQVVSICINKTEASQSLHQPASWNRATPTEIDVKRVLLTAALLF